MAQQDQEKKVVVGELGRTRNKNFNANNLINLGMLAYPNNLSVYEKMATEDAQVASILRAVMLPITSTTWRIDPAGADQEVVDMVSQDLRLPIIGETASVESRGRVSWEEHLHHALQMLVYGHSYFEKVFEVREEDDRVHLRKIALRPQQTISKINVALDGGLESITQKAFFDGDKNLEEVEIPVERLLAYVHNDTKKDWIGQSVLRPAFTPWMYKQEELEVERIAIERTGMGIPVYKSSEDDDQDDIDFGQDLVESLRAGDTSGASIRNNSSLEIRGVSGQVYPAGEAIQRHNAEIAKSVLAHALNLDGKGGSYALADIQMGLFIQSLQTIASQIADIATHYLVEDMVYFYTGDKEAKSPKIVFDEIGMQSAFSSSQIAELVNAGVIFTDSALEEHLRRQGGLPEKQDVKDWAKEREERNKVLGDTQSSNDSSSQTTEKDKEDNEDASLERDKESSNGG